MKRSQLPNAGTVLRKCPKCRIQVRLDRMQEHLAKPHPRRNDRRPILNHSLPNTDGSHAKSFQKCPICGLQVRADYLEKHLDFHHTPPTLPTVSVSVVLPKKVLSHCPECGRGIAEDRLARHIEKFHSYQQAVLEQDALPVRKARLSKVLRECPKCASLLSRSDPVALD
jgi:endogenous inhibitor of DNA gyrase (YacG/DUF329 family)